ncbi:MAG TPA: hypothetical protein PKJ95_06585 [Atribacterota bacterium]|nr:hypothetical protein [Atribacterota bacterium]
MGNEKRLTLMYLDACYEGAENPFIRFYYWLKLKLFEFLYR